MNEVGSAQAFAEAVNLHRVGRHEEAARLYVDLSRSVMTVNLAQNLGLCLGDLGRSDEAEHWLRLALSNRPDDPDIQVALGELLLSVGRYDEGWPLYEARSRTWRGTAAPIGPNPEWMGEPLNGRHVVVIAEQGLGDQIQFARFGPGLKAAGAGRITLTCRPPLARLFRSAQGADEAISVATGEDTALPGPHVWVRYMSLAGRLGVTPDNIPATPYLSAEPRSRGARIGVMASGNPAYPLNSRRSLDAEATERLHALPGAIDLGPDSIPGDMLDAAEVIAGLDLVVTVDTAFAHLAGALGKPVWVLLSHAPDWRWMRERTDSPWYPSARLFRQPKPGDWASVLDDVERLIG